MAIVYGAAFAFAQVLISAGLVNPEAQAWTALLSSAILFAGQDRFVALLSVVLMIAALRMRPFARAPELPSPRSLYLGLLLGLFAIAMLTRYGIMHNYNLTLDEYLPLFQAEIFLDGRFMAPLSDTHLELNLVLQRFFTVVSVEYGYWASNYRPVHAALLALAELVATADLLNPILSVIAAIALADVARQVFPERPYAPVLSVVLLVASPQFVIMSGTGFAFPAHLALNLIWLSLFLRDRFRLHCLAVLVGVLAIGLHQVHFHLLFALPFGIAVLLGYTRTRWTAVPYVVGYLFALALWMSWFEISLWFETGDASVLPTSILGLHYISDYLSATSSYSLQQPFGDFLFLVVNVFRFLLWISPAIVLGGLLSLYFARRIGLIPALSGWAVLVTLVASHVLMPNQMQSWGGRYYHPVLGNLILFAMAGLYVALDSMDRARTQSVLCILLAASILLVPWRLAQLEAKMGPRAAVQEWLETRDVDVVNLQRGGLAFMFDWARNGPFVENRPLIVVGASRDEAMRLGETVLDVDRADLSKIGLPEFTFYEPNGPLSGN